jgi:hypothetical protein
MRPDCSEAEFSRAVIDTAKAFRWRVVHIRPALTSAGRWITPYEGHSGLPDLILARNGRVLLVELKSAAGKATADQRAWLQEAGSNGRLWRPKDWPQIEAELRHGTRLPAVPHLPREDDGT